MISSSTLGGILMLLAAGAGQASAQACPEITTTITAEWFEAVTASAATSVIYPSYGAGTVLSCAQAFVNGGAVVQVEDATITMSAAGFPPAQATVTNANVPTATNAAITATGPGTITVGPDAAQVTVRAFGPGRRVTLDPGAVNVDARCQDPDCQLTALGVEAGYLVAAYGATVDVTFNAGGTHTFDAFVAGTISATGPAISGNVNNGQATLIGPDPTCYVGADSSCTVSGDRAQVSAGQPGGYVAIAQGTGGRAEAYNRGTISVVGGNTATVVSSGFGSIGSGAQVFISSGNGDVFLSSGATGTLEIGATVFSAPAATVTAAPDTTFASIGTRDDFVILEARSAVLPSLVRKRMAAPQPTSACDPFLIECPNLRGELNCVDVKTDIFNCGGCALEGKGTDCTAEDPSGRVVCIDGVCVSR